MRPTYCLLIAAVFVVATIAACSSGRTEVVLTVDVTGLRGQTAAYDDPEVPSSGTEQGDAGSNGSPFDAPSGD